MSGNARYPYLLGRSHGIRGRGQIRRGAARILFREHASGVASGAVQFGKLAVGSPVG
jgi:hypothetical protein